MAKTWHLHLPKNMSFSSFSLRKSHHSRNWPPLHAKSGDRAPNTKMFIYFRVRAYGRSSRLGHKECISISKAFLGKQHSPKDEPESIIAGRCCVLEYFLSWTCDDPELFQWVARRVKHMPLFAIWMTILAFFWTLYTFLGILLFGSKE